LHGSEDARIQPITRSIARPGGCCQFANKAYRTHGFLDERGALISQIDGEIKTEQKISLFGRAGSVLKVLKVLKVNGDRPNSRALAAHYASHQHEERCGGRA
jgi:hypothetical protein